MTNPKSRVPNSEFPQIIEQMKLEDTAYIQAETELERTISFLNATLESIPDGIVVVDLAGYTLAFNHKFLQIWNLSERLVEPENTQERLAFLANQVKDVEEYLKKIEELNARPEAEGYDILELKDGRIIERHTQPQRLSDKIIGRVWSFRDITEQKQVSDALRRNEANFAAAQRIAHIGNWETNLLTNQLTWSDEIYNIFGLKPQEFDATADAFFAQVHPDDLDYVLKAVGEAIAGGKPYNVDHRIVRASGEIGYVHQEAEVTFDETGQPVRLLGIVQDVTDRKRLELQIHESLERRGRQVQVSTQVAQDIAAATDLASLYQRVVTQVKEQFGYYHTQLLRYNPAMDVVALVAGYGKIGAQMLAEGHQMPTGTGLIGTAAALGVSVLRSDISADPNWQANSLLPHTKGELVVPITLGQADVKAQATALEYFINSKIDGFIVCVIDPAVITPITQRALNQGLQVVVQGGDLGEENQTALVGVKEYEVGYLLGIQAGEWAKTHLSPGERLKLGVLHNRLLQPLVHREEGIIAGIKATFGNNLEIIGGERAVDPARGLAAAEKWLRDYPHLKMILGVNDGGALGAYQAVIAAGKDDKNAFFIGGVDGVNEALMAIKAGGAYQTTVDQSGSEMGAVAVRALVAAIVKQPYQPVNYIETRPINGLNVDEFLYKDRQRPIDKFLPNIDLSGIKIALSIQSITNPFYASMVDGAKQEAAQLGVDLIVNEPKQVLGVLDVQSDVIGALDTDDQLMLEGLCGQIAVAIESTRLLEETKIFRQFAEASAQGFGMATLDGVIFYTNPAGTRILGGTKPEDSHGKYIASLYSEASQQRLQDEVLPTVMQTGEWVGELPFLLSTGKSVPAIQNIFFIHDEKGQPRYLANVFTDISERKQAEVELENHLRELNALQRLMSHEGWQAFQSTRAQATQAYLFDQSSVQETTIERLGLSFAPMTSNEPGDASPAGNGHIVAKSMVVQGEIIGALGIQNDVDNPLLPEEQAFLDAVTAQVAEALERARLLEQMQKRAIEMETVAQVSAAASTLLDDPDKLLQEVVDLTKERFSLYHAHIYLLNKAEDTLKLAAGAGEIGRQMMAEGWSIPAAREYSLVARAARTRETVVVGNVQQSIDFMPNPLLPETRSEMAIPLIIGDSVLGVLDVQSDKINRFSDDDVRVQTTLAAQVAVALRNAGLYQQTQSVLAETRILYETSQALVRATNLDEALSGILLTLTQEQTAIGADSVTLTTVDVDEHGEPAWSEIVAWWFADNREPPYPIGTRFPTKGLTLTDLWAKDPSKPIFLSDTRTDKQLDEMTRRWYVQADTLASVLMPLHLAGRWIGQLSISWTEPHEFSEQDRRIYRVLMRQIATTVDNQRLTQQMQEALAETEALYTASHRLSAAHNLPEALAVVVEGMRVPNINRALLTIFEYLSASELKTLTVAANWYSGEGTPPMPAGSRYSRESFSLFFSSEPIFSSDAQQDERVDPVSLEVFQRQNIRALAVLPLWVGSRQLGALVLEAEVKHEFTEREIQPYLSLAAQLAIAIDNQRLLAETRAALAEVEQTQRRYTVQAWEAYRDRLKSLSYEQVRDGVAPWGDNLLPEITQRLPQTADGRPQLISGGQESEVGSSLIIPLTVRGETIGVLGLQEIDGAREWSPEEIALIEAISEQLAQTAESIRLTDETQQRAARERRVNEIGEKIQASQSLEEALKIAIKEVGLSLQAPQTTVKLEVQ